MAPTLFFLLIKSRIKPQLTFSLFFYDLSTFDPCFLLLSIAYTLGAMFGGGGVGEGGVVRLMCVQYELSVHHLSK